MALNNRLGLVSKKSFMKFTFYWAKPFLIIGILYSCSPVFYFPENASAPLLTKKGETDISVGFTPTSLSLNTAYAFTDKFSGQINLKGTKYKTVGIEILNSYDSEINNYLQTNFGIGYTKKINSNFIFESYLFYENHFFKVTAEAKNWQETRTSSLNGKSYTFKTQNSLAYCTKKFCFVTTLSINKLKFYDISGKLDYYSLWIYDNKYFEKNYYNHTFFEPALTLKVKSSPINYYIQYLFSYDFKESYLLRVKNVITVGFYKTLQPRRTSLDKKSVVL